MAKTIARISEKRAPELLSRLSNDLAHVGFQRHGVLFNRESERGVTHVVELLGDRKNLSLAVGVSFAEVLRFARDAGANWYLYVGEGRFDPPASIGTCVRLICISWTCENNNNGKYLSCDSLRRTPPVRCRH
jgi:hypothetical protein